MSRPAIVISGWAHTAESVLPLAECLAPVLECEAFALSDLLRADEGRAAVTSYGAGLQSRLEQMPTPVCLIGWSTGAMVAVEAASQCPDRIAALLLLSASPRFCASKDFPEGVPPQEVRAMRARLHRRQRDVLSDFFVRAAQPASVFPAWIEHRRAAALAIGLDVLEHGLDYLLTTDLRPCLSRVTQPCLVLHGDDDRIVPRSAGRALARGLPRAVCESIPGAGHALPQLWLDAIAPIMAEFVEGLS